MEQLIAIGWNKDREDWHYMGKTCLANIPDNVFPVVVEVIGNSTQTGKEMVSYRGADILKDRFVYA